MLVTYFIFKDKTAAWRRVSVMFQPAGSTKYEKEIKIIINCRWGWCYHVLSPKHKIKLFFFLFMESPRKEEIFSIHKNFLVNSNEYHFKSYIIWLKDFTWFSVILISFTPEIEQFTPGATGEPCHVQLTLLTKSFTQESPWVTEDVTTDKKRERDLGRCLYLSLCYWSFG